MVMRQKVWIDQHVQGVLVGRVILYWSGILLYFGLSIGCYQWWQNPEWTMAQHMGAMFEQVGPCLPTLFLLLPLVIFDIVRLSNRFAGPIYRLRTHLKELNQNSNTCPLHFRDDDYWQQLADPINTMQLKLLTMEQQLATLASLQMSLGGVNLSTVPLQREAPTAVDDTQSPPIPIPITMPTAAAAVTGAVN
ncbi:MAG: hypothetical protein IT423_02030 [Pirellulaceae bacterium]|nr:hypothetical protein [Pirellulaceae bacterium]